MQSQQKGQYVHWEAATIQNKIKTVYTDCIFFKKSKQNNEEATASTIATEDIEIKQSEIDNKSSEETASDICVTSNSSVPKV